jgi:hypothetical protein
MMPMSQIDMVAIVPSDHRKLQVCGDFSPKIDDPTKFAEIHVVIRQGDITARGNEKFTGANWQVFIDRETGLTEGPAIACAVAFLEKDPGGLETLSWVQKVQIKKGTRTGENEEFHFPEPESFTSAQGQVGDERSVSSSLAIFEEANPQGAPTVSWHREFSIRTVQSAEVDSSPSAE